MTGRIPRLLVMFALLGACSERSCSDGPPRLREVGLEAFEAPYFEDQLAEARYLTAQYYRVSRDRIRSLDIDYDSEIHVSNQFQNLAFDLGDHDRLENHLEVIQRMLAPTPEVMRFRGARQNSVAIGLMAYSIWRRDLEPESASVEELRACSRIRLGKKPRCVLSARSRYLHRAMLMAEYADGELFAELKRQMPPLRRRIPRPPVNKDVPADVDTP